MGEEDNARYASGPDIAIIADTPTGLARGQAAARAIGGQIVFAADLDEAESRLGTNVRVDTALCLVESLGQPADALFAAIEDAARDGRFGSVVAVAFDSLDAAHGRLDHRDVEILCDPSDAELIGALALAAVSRAPVLNEPKGDGGNSHLLRISEEVGRIARALAELSKGGADGRTDLGEAPFAYRPE
ncbi:MAG: hypothetical protein LC634_05000, partial [Sphingomonadales bacterium]|nr:hypothetical protein [Sphingomonadales bacterium]